MPNPPHASVSAIAAIAAIALAAFVFAACGGWVVPSITVPEATPTAAPTATANSPATPTPAHNLYAALSNAASVISYWLGRVEQAQEEADPKGVRDAWNAVSATTDYWLGRTIPEEPDLAEANATAREAMSELALAATLGAQGARLVNEPEVAAHLRAFWALLLEGFDQIRAVIDATGP